MNNMISFLELFIIIPFAGFIINMILPEKKENLISWTAFTTIGLHLTGAVVFLIIWFINGCPSLNLRDIVIFKTESYEFFIDFCFDRITAVYLFVGSVLTFLVTVCSRYYLHREDGYRRFFNAVLFFDIGYNMAIFSGNLETLFIGW